MPTSVGVAYFGVCGGDVIGIACAFRHFALNTAGIEVAFLLFGYPQWLEIKLVPISLL